MSLALVVVCVIAGATTYVLGAPAVGQAGDQLQMLQTQLADEQHLVQQIPMLAKRKDMARAGLQDLSLGRDAISSMMAQFTAISKRHNVIIKHGQLTTATPAPATPAPVITPPSDGATPGPGVPPVVNEATQVESPFISQPITVTLVGGYRNLLLTLADLSSGPVLLRIDQEPSIRVADGGDRTMVVKGTLLVLRDDRIMRNGNTNRRRMDRVARPSRFKLAPSLVKGAHQP